MKWTGIGSWGKCEACIAAYRAGRQHPNSLNCYKLGILLSSLKIPLEDLIVLIRELKVPAKYSVFSFPLNIASKGVVILYFESLEDMLRVTKEFSQFLAPPGARERLFFDKLVNVEWIGPVNYRRGCPEYDRKFGDWRNWSKGDPSSVTQ